MKIDPHRLHSLLGRVHKPSQYLGGEINVIKKDFDAAEVRVALVFPDKYEIGMSHVGLKILYDILNRLPHVVCERCFAPDLDMERALHEEGIPLFSLESKIPLNQFDLVGFSLTYELTYVNMLTILDRGGIPIWQRDRSDTDPIIMAGGGCTMNSEPVADFLDAAAIGDGEELILDVVEEIRKWKLENVVAGTPPQSSRVDTERTRLLNNLSKIEGLYIPSFFCPEYNVNGTLARMAPLKEGYTKINKRIVTDLNRASYPTRLLVPSVQIVHDRIGIEIQRGCNRACRFCQAGYIDRPVRQRSPETVLGIAEESIRETGMDQLSLLSLSAADYSCLVPLLKELNARYATQKIAISVPATRTEKLTPELIEQIKKVRKTGFTIAPEAGSERMRRVINKGNKVDDLYRAVEDAFSAGWNLLKLYYMVGLPFEEEADLRGIANEANASMRICRHYTARAELHLSVSSFVPKPHTPFQWGPQMTPEETREKYNLIKGNLESRRIRFSHHHPEMSYLEGVFSRGDRRVSELIYLGYREGCRFDEWEEHFDFPKWQRAIKKWGGDIGFYLHRQREREECLPWDHLFGQMDKGFLWEEWERAKDAAHSTISNRRQGLKPRTHHHAGFTEDCSLERCSNCGVCDYQSIKNRIYVSDSEAVVSKKAHREWYGWGGGTQELGPATLRRGGSTGSPSRAKSKDSGQASDQQPTFAKAMAGKLATSSNQAVIIRVRFSKTGDARYMGHLELMGVIKRAISRARLPVRYSEGFHPKMRLAMGHPLSVGIESRWEFFDIDLTGGLDPEILKDNLNPLLPEGLRIISAELVDRNCPSLYSSLTEVTYEAFADGASNHWPINVKDSLERFDHSKDFMWLRDSRRGSKLFNLKEILTVDLNSFPQRIVFKAKINPNGSLGPREILKALCGINEEELGKVQIKKMGIALSP